MEETYENKRNYGIDIFRILSMLMIVTLHVLGHGGLLYSGIERRENILFIIEAFALSAVNCYALITGYLGVGAKFTKRKLFFRWLQVFFYSVVIFIFVCFLHPDAISHDVAVTAFFPVFRVEYWYFTAYVAVFLLAPFINAILEKTNRREAVVTLLVLFSVTSLLPCVFATDTFSFEKGYTPVWLIIMYVFGYLVKKHDLFSKIKPVFLILIVIASVALSWCSRMFSFDYCGILFEYTSPTMLITALSMLAIFSKIKLRKGIFTAVCKKVSSLTFGVYLIHDNPLVRRFVILDRFSYLLEKSVPYMLLMIFVFVISIFIICSAIEYLRTLLFGAIGSFATHIKERGKNNG